MATVTIKIHSQASSLFQLSIDDHVILKINHLYDNDAFQIDLSTTKTHLMTWFVKGNTGESYSIEVVSPIQLPAETATLGDDGQDFGYLKINLPSI
jgi:hypothetical protein